MCNKKAFISDINLTITADLKNSCKLLNTFVFHEIYHMANINVEVL